MIYLLINLLIIYSLCIIGCYRNWEGENICRKKSNIWGPPGCWKSFHWFTPKVREDQGSYCWIQVQWRCPEIFIRGFEHQVQKRRGEIWSFENSCWTEAWWVSSIFLYSFCKCKFVIGTNVSSMTVLIMFITGPILEFPNFKGPKLRRLPSLQHCSGNLKWE